jgi:hypothetical protein
MISYNQFTNRFLSGRGEKTSNFEESLHFQLHYKNLVIGDLTFEDGGWVFQYTSEFKSQEELKPISDFPDVNKIYKSTKLWPIFVSRIPSIATPYVLRKIEKQNIDSSNEGEMLKAFGKRSINNPFLLTPA